MSLIGIVFGIVFVTLLLKAICETIWGLLLIGHGVVCHTIAAILNLIASTLRLWKRITKSKNMLKPEPKRIMTLAEGLVLIHAPYSDEAKRIRATFRQPA